MPAEGFFGVLWDGAVGVVLGSGVELGEVGRRLMQAGIIDSLFVDVGREDFSVLCRSGKNGHESEG